MLAFVIIFWLNLEFFSNFSMWLSFLFVSFLLILSALIFVQSFSILMITTRSYKAIKWLQKIWNSDMVTDYFYAVFRADQSRYPFTFIGEMFMGFFSMQTTFSMKENVTQERHENQYNSYI